MVPENIHTHPVEGVRGVGGWGGYQKPKFLKESMELNWDLQRGGERDSNQKPPVGVVWIFYSCHVTQFNEPWCT